MNPSFIPQIFGTSIRIFILWIRRSSFSRLSKGKNQHDSMKCYQNRSKTFLCFLGLGCSCKRNIFDFNATIMRHSWNDVHFSSIDWLGPRFSGSIDKYEYFMFVESKFELCNDSYSFQMSTIGYHSFTHASPFSAFSCYCCALHWDLQDYLPLLAIWWSSQIGQETWTKNFIPQNSKKTI